VSEPDRLSPFALAAAALPLEGVPPEVAAHPLACVGLLTWLYRTAGRSIDDLDPDPAAHSPAEASDPESYRRLCRQLESRFDDLTRTHLARGGPTLDGDVLLFHAAGEFHVAVVIEGHAWHVAGEPPTVALTPLERVLPYARRMYRLRL